MSWASKRKTTRAEDLAYCLMGMFGINMPLLYGEGEKAFTRLQEEIMKVSDDHSLFAWKSSEKYSGLLATSPAAFFNSGEIIPFNPSGTLSGAITVNNKGIHLKLDFGTVLQDVGLAILPCIENGKEVAIYLRAISETNECFVRILSDRLELLNQKDSSQSAYRKKSICVRQERRIRKNESSLLKTAAKGHEAVMKLLLEKGAELETKDDDRGRTPLLLAAENGHEAVVKLLLEKGAELETKDDDRGQTPLSLAAKNGHKAVVKLLLEKGVELETKDDDLGQTPLLLAAENGHEAVVKLLLEKGAKLKATNYRSRQTPLVLAIENGHNAVAKLLLEKGAELEATDWRSGQKPISLAVENGHEVVVKLLLEKGAKLEAGGYNR
jgi:ankyrin repeat protein